MLELRKTIEKNASRETFEHGPTRSRDDGLGAQLCAGASKHDAKKTSILNKKERSLERNLANLVTKKLCPRETKSRKRNQKVKKNVKFWIRPTGSWKGALAEQGGKL